MSSRKLLPSFKSASSQIRRLPKSLKKNQLQDFFSKRNTQKAPKQHNPIIAPHQTKIKIINANPTGERFKTFKNVLSAALQIDKKIILEEFVKSISFRKIIDDVAFPIIGFLLQQLERTPNKDFKLYIDTLRQIGYKNIYKGMFSFKNFKLDIKNLTNALHKIKTDANADLIKSIMEIHEKYTIVNIDKNITEWIMKEENIINTLAYFSVVISIRLICTILITIIPTLNIFNIMKPIIKKHAASNSDNSLNIDLYDSKYDLDKIDEEHNMQDIPDNKPVIIKSLESKNEIEDEDKYAELTAKTSELILIFKEQKYITFLRKLPGLLLIFLELNTLTQELEPGINLNTNDFLESIELSDEEQIKKYFTQLMNDSKTSQDSVSKIILEGITPFLDLYNQHADEITNVDISYHAINQPIKLPIKHIDFDEHKQLLTAKLLNMINLYNSSFANNYISYKMPHTHLSTRKKHSISPAFNISSKIDKIPESIKPHYSNNTLKSLIK